MQSIERGKVEVPRDQRTGQHERGSVLPSLYEWNSIYTTWPSRLKSSVLIWNPYLRTV